MLKPRRSHSDISYLSEYEKSAQKKLRWALMDEENINTKDKVESVFVILGVIVLGIIFYSSFGLFGAGLALLSIGAIIFIVEYIRKGEDAVDEFDIISPAVKGARKERMKQYYQTQDIDYPEDFTKLINNAESPTVTAECLTNHISENWSISYLPLVDYIQESERPHYHFINDTGITKNDKKVESDSKFRTSILLTSHRVLIISGQSGVDFVDVLSYEDVTTCRIKEARLAPRFIIGTKETKYSMVVHNATHSDLEKAGQFVGEKTSTSPDVKSEWLSVDAPELRTTKLEPKAVVDDNLRKKVKDKKRAGWKIAEIDNSEGYVVMYNSKGGGVGRHGLVALFTAGWTFGAGNYAYEKATRRRNREKIVLRKGGNKRTNDEGDHPPTVDNNPEPEPAQKLRELKQLRDEDIITEEDFQEKKEDLLNRI